MFPALGIRLPPFHLDLAPLCFLPSSPTPDSSEREGLELQTPKAQNWLECCKRSSSAGKCGNLILLKPCSQALHLQCGTAAVSSIVRTCLKTFSFFHVSYNVLHFRLTGDLFGELLWLCEDTGSADKGGGFSRAYLKRFLVQFFKGAECGSSATFCKVRLSRKL